MKMAAVSGWELGWSSNLNFLFQFAFLLPKIKYEPHCHASEDIVGRHRLWRRGKLNKNASETKI